MKIGIDLRFLKNDFYSSFVMQLVKSIIKSKKNTNFIIYSNKNIEGIMGDNVILKKVDIKIGTIKEQINFLNILKKDENNLMLFFNHFKPVFYKGEYIILVGSLKDIYYMNFSSYIEKYKYLYLIEKNLKNCYKLICLDENTKNELVEKFNIKEEKINLIDGFFPEIKTIDIYDEKIIKTNIKTKNNIINNFFIYSGGNSIEKNYEKLINVFSRLKKDGKNIDLVFLGEEIGKNINLRNIILENKLEKNIHFLGDLSLNEKKELYKESLGTIFTSFYEPFPFSLTDPLFFNANIISSDLENIKNIFKEKIKYFSPISINNIYEKIKLFIEENNTKVNDYNEIKNTYNIENTTKQLIEIIK